MIFRERYRALPKLMAINTDRAMTESHIFRYVLATSVRYLLGLIQKQQSVANRVISNNRGLRH